MIITIYEPICGPIKSKKGGNYFTVNGAKSEDRDKAIALASKHVSIRDGECEIKRVNEIKVQDYDYYENRPY